MTRPIALTLAIGVVPLINAAENATAAQNDPPSAIVNDPNRPHAPHYIARLIAKVISVSPKTPDRPTPPRPGRQTASFSQAKPTTSAGAENCVHHVNQINHSSDYRPLQFIVRTTVIDPKS